MTEASNPYAAPVQISAMPEELAEISRPDPIHRAGFGVRAGARIIDMVFLQIVGGMIGIVVGVFLAIADGADAAQHRLQGVSFLNQMLMGLVASLAYEVIAEGIGGATVGKLICGLRVLKDDFKPVTMGAALIRNLGYFIDALFFGYVGYLAMEKDEWYRRHGDDWADTLVIKAAGVPTASQRSIGRILLAIAAATAVNATIMLAFILA